MLKKNNLTCDLCVVGGGISGMIAAISAAREGLNVVLMHERPVLGGNASSEIRMWICGVKGNNNRETGILEEIALESLYRNPTKSYAIWDTILYDFVKREKFITLLLNCTCMDASVENGDFKYNRDTKITSVTGYQMTTQTFYEVSARFFCDSSGDSILAPLCNAHFKIGREAGYEYNENTTRTEPDDMTMGMSCLLQGRETHRDISFIAPSWSTHLTEKDFENRVPNLYDETENFWYLELGGNQNTIDDTEKIRDELLSLAVGTWDYIKNSGNHDSKKWDLDFLGFLPGKRESRRMCGEYTVSQNDICSATVFEDEVAYGGWPIDDHYPGGFYHKGTPNTDIPTSSPYSIPYRALYSENIDNLFFAGRNVSMTHIAMSSMRVMATCGLMGEAVGKAAYLACKNNLVPHEVYLKEIKSLQELLLNEDCFLPSKTRNVSDICKNAQLNIEDNVIRNGQDRAHAIYNTNETDYAFFAENNQEISYTFPETKLFSVHIVFCSDLNRTTLPGGECERNHTTRANHILNSVQMYMPRSLCKNFCLYGEHNGIRTQILSVTNNRKRSYHLNLDRVFDKLILIPLDNWGNTEKTPVISFDFN